MYGGMEYWIRAANDAKLEALGGGGLLNFSTRCGRVDVEAWIFRPVVCSLGPFLGTPPNDKRAGSASRQNYRDKDL